MRKRSLYYYRYIKTQTPTHAIKRVVLRRPTRYAVVASHKHAHCIRLIKHSCFDTGTDSFCGAPFEGSWFNWNICRVRSISVRDVRSLSVYRWFKVQPGNRRWLARKLNFRIFRTDSNSPSMLGHNLCSTVCERHGADARKMQSARALFQPATSCRQLTRKMENIRVSNIAVGYIAQKYISIMLRIPKTWLHVNSGKFRKNKG